MNNHLAPTYQKPFGEYWVFWFAISNSYSVVDSSFKTLLDYYLQSDTIEAFKTKTTINEIDFNSTIEALNNYLNDCNTPLTHSDHKSITFNTSNRRILRQYTVRDKVIQVYYDSELVLKAIHPNLAHLSTELSDTIHSTFDIYIEDEQFYLFKNEQFISCVSKKDYHLIQGKFIMHLLCSIHDKEEIDWISTFHGSTITDDNSSILFIGESGKGKSTLCALLTANGFNLLADDVSPMLSKNKNIYYNPSAISIKEGAFNVLQTIIPSFNRFPVVQFNKVKGAVKYIPYNYTEKDSYPCNAIVLVNYKINAKTQLDSICIKTLLETLIPDSWLSPNPLHAKQFLDWLEETNIYKLTYSDTKSVSLEISKLFKQLNKGLYLV